MYTFWCIFNVFCLKSIIVRVFIVVKVQTLLLELVLASVVELFM